MDRKRAPASTTSAQSMLGSDTAAPTAAAIPASSGSTCTASTIAPVPADSIGPSTAAAATEVHGASTEPAASSVATTVLAGLPVPLVAASLGPTTAGRSSAFGISEPTLHTTSALAAAATVGNCGLDSELAGTATTVPQVPVTASVSSFTILDHNVCQDSKCKQYPAHSVACIVCNNPTGNTHQCGKCGRHNHIMHVTSDKVVHTGTGVAKHAWCSSCYTAEQQQPQQPELVQLPPLPKQISEQASTSLPSASSIPSTIVVSGTGSLVTTAGSLARDNTVIASSTLDVPPAEATASTALAGVLLPNRLLEIPFQVAQAKFISGNVIPKGTPSVLVAELYSARLAVGYAKTSLDMPADQRTFIVPSEEIIAYDQGAAECFSPNTPLCIGGRPFQTAFPDCSGPYTLGGLVKAMGLAKLDKNVPGGARPPRGKHKTAAVTAASKDDPDSEAPSQGHGLSQSKASSMSKGLTSQPLRTTRQSSRTAVQESKPSGEAQAKAKRAKS
ncbi:TPA: hypothetical protein ACH3X1_009215 [Trebouxia sp. C0004]